MAEDPRFLLHFKTLAKFNEKLADGTISENRHLCFIKDEGLIWCRGKYYSDGSKLDDLTSIYNGWSISQSDGSTISITLTGKQWNEDTRQWENVNKTLNLNPASQQVAGLMSAADKTKLDGLNTNNISNITFGSNSNNITVTINKDNGNSTDTSTTINLPAASSSNAGTMSAADKTEHDRISTANFALGAVTPSTTTIIVAASKTNISNGQTVANNVTIPGATNTAAGVMSAADKTEHDRINTVNFTLGSVSQAASSVSIAATKTNITNGSSVPNNITLPAATSSLAGVMTAADKVKLDTTLPNQISAETIARQDADETLQSNIDTETQNRTQADTSLQTQINNNKTAADNYTVNGLKISTNPVLDGADIKVTGYTQPSTTGAIAATDTINVALGKLERGLNNEITNRTNAVNSLRDEINNNINNKLDDLENTINENIETRLTEVEGEINNTITPQINTINQTIGNLNIFSNITTDSGTASAATNNDSLSLVGGTNIATSASGKTVTISLDNTVSLTRINASTGFFQQSDKRLKSNIKPLKHTLEDICAIPTDSFILNGEQNIGTIAQDIEKIVPELVCECEIKAISVNDPENFTKVEKNGETYVLIKEVDYAKLSILALEGIKLLKSEIDKIKDKLMKE